MKIRTLLFCLIVASSANAQTEVTKTYIQNPDFEARYAGWLDEGTTRGAVGGFVHQTNASFFKKNGQVYMEKWVSQGSNVSNCTISQELKGLTTGTYLLKAGAQNIQQGSSAKQTGAYLFANDQETEVSDSAEYDVTFTVIDGKATIGFKTKSATGNWACIDNFRLYRLETDMEAVHEELQKLITEAEGIIGDGATASELQTAIDNAKALLTAATTDNVSETANALKRATLNYRISNGTGAVPTVVTNPYVAQGVTIALGRSTVNANGATIQERGFCWSLEPDPTILDERTTNYFTNNGQVYRIEHLEPATIYYVRAYALTKEYQAAYGDVVKIATQPRGTVTYWYNNGASEQENYRINSALAECQWMYNNVANIQGFGISCSYGSGTPTADCGYGGSMRVGPSYSYQQTGTILHETNHGVGVGTTWQWYSNGNLRENTTHGKWLGPRANDMVRFLQNDAAAFMTGDGTHMWGSTTSSIPMKSYAINGANEDSYSPADQLLYWGNIFLTHALHQDGLPCSSSVGFATPAFVFQQQDNVKYYIRSEVADYGLTTFLGHNNAGTLKNIEATTEEALADDNLAWYISYNPKTGYYTFQNAGTGKYIGLSSGTIRALSTATAFHLFPSREKSTMGDFSDKSYWITANKGTYALKAGTSSCSTTSFDNGTSAEDQRWFFLKADVLGAYESGAQKVATEELDQLIANVRNTKATPHVANADTLDITLIDEELDDVLLAYEQEKEEYTTAAEVKNAIKAIESAFTEFLSKVTPETINNPFDLTFLLQNAAIDDNSGWSDKPTFSYSCCEYFGSSAFDFNQTTTLKLPKGTYEVRTQAFQRPGTYANVYTDYVTNGTNNVKGVLYAKTKTKTLKNIYDDAQTTSQGTGSVAAATKVYIPNTMEGAQNFFKKGLYDNSVVLTTTVSATMKLGIRSTATGGTNFWTIFDNFRLYFHGAYSADQVTPVTSITEDPTTSVGNACYDLSGRRVTNPTRGLYIRNGKKIIIR